MVSSRTRIVELNEQECHERLAAHHPAWAAWLRGGRRPPVATVPSVNYAYHEERIFFRTSEGSKL